MSGRLGSSSEAESEAFGYDLGSRTRRRLLQRDHSVPIGQRRWRGRRIALLAVLSLVGFLLAGSGAGTAGTTFAVDTTVDGIDASPGDGQCATAGSDCTLRAAIQEANAWAGADTITLPAGTYTLTIAGTGEDAAATGDLDITEDLTINGAGDAVTAVDGNSLDTVLHILAPAVVVELTGLDVTGGDGGFATAGGILNVGTLTLTGSTVSSNYTDMGAGGIYNDAGSVTLIDSLVVGNDVGMGGAGILSSGGSLTVVRSLVAENGQWAPTGGIRNWGSTALVIDSTIRGNAGGTGGISNGGAGTMTIVGSTITGNIGSRGGGIENGEGTMTVANSTISGNTASRGPDQKGGGIYHVQGTVTLANVTITGNTAGSGGGVYKELGALVEVRNTVIGGNTAADGPDCFNNLTSQDYNLIGDTTNCTLSGSTGNNLTGVDPRLGPLQDNGGLTQTQELLAGSPAIDSGNPATPGSGGFACEATDQRGVTRSQGAACDIGAFETVSQVAAPAPDALVMMSLSPCAIFDTRTAVAGQMGGGETRSFGIVGSGDFTSQGGSATGCGVPGFDGVEAQAQAVLLNLVAISPAGGGNLKAWAGDAAEATGGVVNYQALSPAMNNSNAIVVGLNQTAAGEDIKVKANGAGVHVRGVVLGYFVSGHDTSLDTFVIAAAKDSGDQGGIDTVASPGKLLVESVFTTAFPADAVVTASAAFATGPTTATSVVIWLEVDTAGDPERCADYIRDQGKNAAWREESLIAGSRVEISVTAAIPLPAAGSHAIALCAQAFPEIAGVQIAGLTGVVSPSPNNDVTVTFLAP